MKKWAKFDLKINKFKFILENKIIYEKIMF